MRKKRGSSFSSMSMAITHVGSVENEGYAVIRVACSWCAYGLRSYGENKLGYLRGGEKELILEGWEGYGYAVQVE